MPAELAELGLDDLLGDVDPPKSRTEDFKVDEIKENTEEEKHVEER
jgi:hypothetical protein